MKWLFISFGAIFTITLIFSSAFGRLCYECNTFKDPIGCKTGSLNESYLQDCQQLYKENRTYFCRKIYHNVDKMMGVSDERIVRQCGWEDTKRDCYNRAGFGSRITVCSCYEKDGCNSALNLPISPLLILSTIAASLILRQLL